MSVVGRFLPLPVAPSLNERQLAATVRERFAELGDGATTLTLSLAAIPDTVEVWKNGAKLDEDADAISYEVETDGRTITLTEETLDEDVFVVRYIARAGG